jgi:hypothetical protein
MSLKQYNEIIRNIRLYLNSVLPGNGGRLGLVLSVLLVNGYI